MYDHELLIRTSFNFVFQAQSCQRNFLTLFIFCCRLDYCGIALLTVGSFVPWLYYGFYHSQVAHIVYLVAIIVLGTSCIIVSLFDKFAAPSYRPVRAGKMVFHPISRFSCCFYAPIFFLKWGVLCDHLRWAAVSASKNLSTL